MTIHRRRLYFLLLLVVLPVDCARPAYQRIGNASLYAIPPAIATPPAIYLSCTALLTRYRAAQLPTSAPPKSVPEEHREAFTLGGRIPLELYYVDDTSAGKGSHYSYGRPHVASLVAAYRKALDQPQQGSSAEDRFTAAIAKYRPLLLDKAAVVFGSMDPWHEALLLAAGAKHVTTLEYNRLTYGHDQITTVIPSEFTPPKEGFDVALSSSSFDHDGLGRYGEPMNPVGDILAMKLTRCLLKPGGLFFFSVPIGPDVVVYNLHRRYGPIRLPLMLEGWDIVDILDWQPEKLTAPADYRRSYEPVFVLQRPPKEDSARKESAEL